MRYFVLIFVTIFIQLMYPSPTTADGKLFVSENVPLSIPYQRTIISHNGDMELLVLQSRYDGMPEDFGWIVPVPDKPKLGTIETTGALLLFESLTQTARPDVVNGWDMVSVYIIYPFLLYVLLLWIGLLAIKTAFALKKMPLPRDIAKFRKCVIVLTIIAVLPAIATGFRIYFKVFDPHYKAHDTGGIEIMEEQTVGVYDIKTIKSDNTGELTGWLKQHNYAFNSLDENAFNYYIKQNWCFVAVRLNAKKAEEHDFRTGSHMTSPLIMVFNSKTIVYPLALTATQKSAVAMDLFLLGSHKFKADNRFLLDYADTFGYFTIDEMLKERVIGVNMSDSSVLTTFPAKYLTKYSANLSPEDMRNDAVFDTSPDDKPFRNTIWEW